jgi:predicted DNA-binding transcriptional regulator YafY
MNRTDRLLAIVLELQARRYTRAEDLAGQFEVSVRTIYRDVLALCEAGVPVVATPGYGYALAPGYFLPPLMLTPAEAGMLLLGATFVAAQMGPPYTQAVSLARKKIEKILPDATRQEVEFLLDSFRFAGRIAPAAPTTETHLAVIQRAVVEREVLHLRYHARHGEPGERDVEPHGLVYVEGTWILGAYCRVRQDMRHFRLDRIDAVWATGEQFTRRQTFTVREPPALQPGADEVLVIVQAAAARWVRESRHYSFVREEAHPDGVLMVFRPRAPGDLLPWLLSWGAAVHVLAPPAVRRELHAAAQAIATLYEEV